MHWEGLKSRGGFGAAGPVGEINLTSDTHNITTNAENISIMIQGNIELSTRNACRVLNTPTFFPSV